MFGVCLLAPARIHYAVLSRAADRASIPGSKAVIAACTDVQKILT